MRPGPLDADRTPLWHSAPATPEELEQLAPGQGMARYRLERVLGEGTYGRVHLARQDVLGRKVAVKILHRRHGSTKDEIRAFANEALILADLNHPGIVPVFDAGWTDDGFFYIVSRYVEGGDLSALLARGRLAHVAGAQIVMAIAQALGYAHSRGLVHRDIKPANILIDPPGKPLLTDFGVALRDKDFGRGSGLVGTPAYMSPEQARGEGNRVDGRSDIFSLGVVFYELLTGVRPFRGETQRELLNQVMSASIRPPRELDGRIPAVLEQICVKALARRASERYATADDMARALGDELAGFSTDHVPAIVALSGGRGDGPPLTLPTRGSHHTATISEPTTVGSPEFMIIPRGLRPYDAHDAPFFLDMLPGPRDAAGMPECIEFWKSRIEGQRGEDCFRVGLLFGPSGCGKTSLVRAGLLPALAKRISVVHIEATAHDIETRLLEHLKTRCPDLAGEIGLASAFIAVRKGLSLPQGTKVLVVIDHFERWLRLGQLGVEKGLAAALRQCDGEHVQALVVVRDDTWLAASRFMRALGDRLVDQENSAAVEPFDRRHARKILAALGKAYGRLPVDQGTLSEEQDKFLDGAISALDDGNPILPIRLALYAAMAKDQPWAPETLTALDVKGDGPAAFLDWAFDSRTASPEYRRHQPAARAVLAALLPEPGRDCEGPERTHHDLLVASAYGSEPCELDSLLHILGDELGVITQTQPKTVADLDRSPPRLECRYQLTSDFLVGPVRDWLARGQTTSVTEQPPRTVVPGSVPLPRALVVNINTATANELRNLPGVGKALAQRIIAGRPYHSIDGLLRVKGIGARNLHEMSPFITT